MFHRCLNPQKHFIKTLLIWQSFYLKKLLAKIDKIDLNNRFAIIESLNLTGVEGALVFDKLAKMSQNQF